MKKHYAHNEGAVGLVQSVGGVINYSDSEVVIGTLPAGCVILDTVVEVVTPFNAATTNVLTVGTNTPADNLMAADDITEGSTGFNKKATPSMQRTAAETTVKAKYAQTGTAATTGKANVLVFFTRIAE